MNRIHQRSNAPHRSIYDRWLPASQAEALLRRLALEAEQRAYRDRAEDRAAGGRPGIHPGGRGIGLVGRDEG
jgi:hypothetical protein